MLIEKADSIVDVCDAMTADRRDLLRRVDARRYPLLLGPSVERISTFLIARCLCVADGWRWFAGR